ncbi:GNAT family N-acetyltransferase [Amycolatopsis acidiphila]|uniref:GNAT family N-acetyltransferase n=1 Tax=Amycolatopsis acidiphila TaxID=715473 RepID=A0A558AD53_9PSEU|nr:GNAT family N-acetyltransferase [Amycolatopsis acidiphila]TVT22175.1 GNAT family N-acetyltransferase [Amycolatopsis acidiphila]UIJ61627.1 GNAT family N-acetyltransferase [Amycolatopsis acidiphila]GHG58816.1 ElaA protein [Amycolatopsis acidiphila]
MNVAGTELTAAQLYDILILRADVFVVEQDCPYLDPDGRDLLPGTRHLWVSGEQGIESYLRVLDEGAHYRVGRVVTAQHARGRGLAARLMNEALEIVGDADSVLDAQTYARGFYAKFGYVPEGDEFDEDGIMHITMWRRVAARTS